MFESENFKFITMINNSFFSEIFYGAGSFVAVISLLFALYYLFLIYRRKEFPEFPNYANSLNAPLSVSFLSITILILVKQALPENTEYFADGVKYLLIFNSTLIYLPILIYFLQTDNLLKLPTKKALWVVLTTLIINVSVILLSRVNQINHTKTFYAVALAVAIVMSASHLLFSYLVLVKREERSDRFILFSSILIYLLLISLILIDKGALRREAMRALLYSANIIIFILTIIGEQIEDNRVPSFCSIGDSENMFKARDIWSEKKSEAIKERLISYFTQEKPYLRKDLSINEVSLYLYTNKTYLSRIINDCFNCNFNQFVNHHRVEEAKRMFISDTELSIKQLCQMSGFGSMATFNIAFKFFSGKSPAEWCKEQLIKGR